MTEILALLVVAIVAAAAAAALFAFSFMLLRRAETGLIALVAAFSLSSALGEQGLTLAGVFVTPFDALSVLFAMAACVRWSGQELVPVQLVWIGVGALIFTSLLFGVYRYGLQAAGNEARATELLYFWSCAAYFSSFRYSVATDRRGPRILMWGAAAVTVVVFAGWGLEMAGYEIGIRFREEGASAFRVVPATAAIFLMSVALVLLPKAAEEGSKWLGLFVVVLMLQVLLLQHRSAWLGALTGFVVLIMLYWPTIKRRIVPYLPLAVLPALLAVAALLLGGALDGVIRALSYSVRQDATLLWRIDGWMALVTQWQDAGAAQKLIGAPFGPGFSRYMSTHGIEINHSPHNTYLAFLLRIGVMGLAAVVVTYAACLRTLLIARRRGGSKTLHSCLIAVLCGQTVFFLFYGPNIMQALFLGSALAVCATAKAARVAAAPGVRGRWQTEGPRGRP